MELQILSIVNSSGFQLIRDALMNGENNFSLIEVDTFHKLEKEIESSNIDLIITQTGIFDFKELEIVAYLSKKRPELPLIVLTESDSPEYAINALKLGATDSIFLKGTNAKSLRIAISKAIYYKNFEIENKMAEREVPTGDVISKSLFESPNIPIMLLSDTGQIYLANDSAGLLFGMTKEELCKHSINELIDVSDPSFERFNEEKSINRKVFGELICIRKDGLKFPSGISSVVFKDADGSDCSSFIFTDLTKQKHAEDSVYKEKSLLRTLIDGLPHAVYVKDKEGRKLVANIADMKLMNCDSEEKFIGKTDFEIYNSEEGNRGYEEDRSVINTGVPIINSENCFIDPNGKKQWRLINKIPLYNKVNEIIGLVGFGHDITDRKIAEQELAWEQYLMHALLDNIPDSIYFKDKESRFIRINKALAKRFSINDPMEAIGLTDTHFFSQLHAQDALADEQRIIETGEPLVDKEEIEIWIDKPPTWVSTTKMPLRGLSGEIIGTFGISRDITERKLNEEQLNIAKNNAEENEKQFRSLFENMIEGFAYCKMIYEDSVPVDFIYLDVNNAFEVLTGLKDVTGKRIRELVPDIRKVDFELFERYDRVAKTGKPERFESYVKSLGDWYSISVYSPKEEYFIVVFDVITERKKSEEELIKAREKAEESDKLKTAFLHNITHEIRTPMNAIIGFSSCLKDPNLEADRHEYFLDIVIKSAHQLLSIINDIVNMATLEANLEKLIEKVVDVNLIMRVVYNQFSREADDKSISLSYSLPFADGQAIINTDENKLIRILSSLLNNAIKFTKTGSIKYGYIPKDGYLEFFVEDTGIGIAHFMQEKIFERFMQVENSLTREYGGSGLGLSIAKAYVEYLGGKIWVKSILGKGSVFYFTIPFNRENVIISEEVVATTESIEYTKNFTVLVAEDEEPNYLLLKEILSDLNCNIIWADDGQKAVDFCKTKGPIDLVLMDLRMPLLNGFEASRQIKKIFPDLPIIAQTSYSSDLDREKAFLCGCSDYITKPFSSELILTKINEYLGKRKE